LTTSAWKDPPRNLKDVVGRDVVISLTLDPDRTVLVVNDGLISERSKWKKPFIPSRRLRLYLTTYTIFLAVGSTRTLWPLT